MSSGSSETICCGLVGAFSRKISKSSVIDWDVVTWANVGRELALWVKLLKSKTGSFIWISGSLNNDSCSVITPC